MSRVPECRVEREEDVQSLDPGLVHGDVDQGAADVDVGGQIAVELCRGYAGLLQDLLHLRRPLLHQKVNV